MFSFNISICFLFIIFRRCHAACACVAHHPLASPMDSSVLSRLLTPTQASLARSKSAAALSAHGADETGNLEKI